MRGMLFVCVAWLAVQACGQELASVMVQPPAAITEIGYISAQQHAEALVASRSFGHCSRRGRLVEGIGMSAQSASDAVRRCCFWGKRKVREIGTAFCPVRRLWVAVVRYE